MANLRTTRNSLSRSYLGQDILNVCNDKDITHVENLDNENSLMKRSNTRTDLEEESSPKKRRKDKNFEPPKIHGDVDVFCWRCHKPGDCFACSSCPRVYHLKCIRLQQKPTGFWPCIECDSIQRAESVEISGLDIHLLAELLSYTLERMKSYAGSEHFSTAVDTEVYDNYKDYILKPMDLSMLDINIKKLQYASTESFLSEAKWMVHNSYIYNSAQSHLTVIARGLIKFAKQECEEIDNCHYCYRHAHTLSSEEWFIEPCDKPHLLIWARLKGFPYWPAKVMKLTGQGVDVRFFGDHNRSIVSPNTCLIYSKKQPFRSKDGRRPNFDRAIEEIETHIKKLQSKFGVFNYAEFRTELDPRLIDDYLMKMLPKCEVVRSVDRSRNNEENLFVTNDKELTLPPVNHKPPASTIINKAKKFEGSLNSTGAASIGSRLMGKTFICEKPYLTTNIENRVDAGSSGFQTGVNSIDFREASDVNTFVDTEIKLRKNQEDNVEDNCTKKPSEDCFLIDEETPDTNIKENFPCETNKQTIKSKRKSSKMKNNRNLRNDFFNRPSTKSVKIFKKSNNQSQHKNSKFLGVGFKIHQDKQIKKVLKPPGSSTKFQHFNAKIMDKSVIQPFHSSYCPKFEVRSNRISFKRRISNENCCDVDNNVGKYSVFKNLKKSENTESVSITNYLQNVNSGNSNVGLVGKTYPKFIEGVLRKNDTTKIVCNENLETNYIIGKPSLDLKQLSVENLAKVLGGRKYLNPVVKVNKLKDEIYRNLIIYKAGIIYLLPDNSLCDGTNSDDQLSETEEDRNLSQEQLLDILGVRGLTVNIIGCDEEENDDDNIASKLNVAEERIENNATTATNDEVDSSNFEERLLSQLRIDDSSECDIDERSIFSSSDDEADEKQFDIMKKKADIISNSLKSLADAKDVQRFKEILKTDLKDFFEELHFQEENYFSLRNDISKGKSIYLQRKRKLISEKKQIFSAKDEKFFSNLKKKNYWCAVCYKKANFYCCYSTFYCSYECQTRDWGKHYSHCSHYSSGSNDPVILSNPKYKEFLDVNSSEGPVYINDLIAVQPTNPVNIEAHAINFQVTHDPNDQRNGKLSLICSSTEQQPIMSKEVAHQGIIHCDETLYNNEIEGNFKSPITVGREQLTVDHPVNKETGVLNVNKMNEITHNEVEYENNSNYEIIDLGKDEELVTNQQPVLIDKNTVGENVSNCDKVPSNLINKRSVPQEIKDLENYGTTVTKVSEKLMTMTTNRKDKPASCKEFLEAFPKEISSIEEDPCEVPELVPLLHPSETQTKPKSIREHLELFSNEIKSEYIDFTEENPTPMEINSTNENLLIPGLEILQKHPHLQAKVEKVDNRNKIVICIPERKEKHMNNSQSSPNNTSSKFDSLVNNNVDSKTVLKNKNSTSHHEIDGRKKSKINIKHNSEKFLDTKLSKRAAEFIEKQDEKNDIFFPSLSPNVSIIRRCNKNNQEVNMSQNNINKFSSSSTEILNRTVPSSLTSLNSDKGFLSKQDFKQYERLKKKKINRKKINSPSTYDNKLNSNSRKTV